MENKSLQNNAQKYKTKDKEHNGETKLHRRHSSAVIIVMIIIYVEQNVGARNSTTTEWNWTKSKIIAHLKKQNE